LSKYSVAVVATGSACAAELATTEHAGVALPVSWGVVLADGQLLSHPGPAALAPLPRLEIRDVNGAVEVFGPAEPT